MIAAADGRTLAYAIDRQGEKSLWVAQAPAYRPKELVAYTQDDGQDVWSVSVSADGSHVVYVYGDPEDPSLSLEKPQPQVWAIDVKTSARTKLGEGTSPAISADGSRVAFLAPNDKRESVWAAPIDGHAAAAPLFYDQGDDSDLQWAPRGNDLAFVSTRGDHSFVGVYRGSSRPLEFLAPSVYFDIEPRWSPDAARIAFARTPGDGGPTQSPLEHPIVPWSIVVGSVARGDTKTIWRSPHTARGSFPTQGGDVDLTWAGNDRLIFISQMDNWPHLYAVGGSGGTARRLTSGAFAVTSFGVSPDARFVYYSANTGRTKGDVDRWHLYRAGVLNGEVRTVTAGASSQWWPTPLAGGLLAYVTATAQQPPLIALAKADGSHPRLLDDVLLPRDFPQRRLVTPSDVTYRAPDGWVIHAQLYSAAGRGRRPAIVFVHGGPMRQMLLTWNPIGYYDNSYAVDQYLVSRGFTVLSVNYRTSVDYGYDFHYALRAAWTGASEYQDVLAGARWLQRQPAVDPHRIGIWGGSWGGYLTALALARNSDVFKAGVDYSGVHDLMHDAQEYFHGEGDLLVDRKPWLRLAWESSPDSSVSRWRSPVLLIQGDDDPDVAFHQMVDLVPRLQKYHVPYRLMVLPDEAHTFLRYASWLRSDEACAAFFEEELR
jgi:dipeptidyl aminopeptidase/acylaminoacyl peptidase